MTGLRSLAHSLEVHCMATQILLNFLHMAFKIHLESIASTLNPLFRASFGNKTNQQLVEFREVSKSETRQLINRNKHYAPGAKRNAIQLL